uniref:Subtilisin-like serine protease pr1c n=1 Tax=Colletotrichum fructicola (strain Nara gc5) TaxID=1213859 RepID=L2GC71_COLFN
MTTSTSAKAEEFEEVPSNYTYILPPPATANETDAVLPALAVNMAFGSPFVRADLVPLTSCPPNITKELDDGTYAPAGKYKFAVKSLRVFGDASKLEEYDVTETQPFRIQYGGVNQTAPARRWF